MSELFKLGKVKLETEIVNLSYRITKEKKNELRVGIVEFELRKPISPGDELRDTVKLIKAFIKEFLPETDIVMISGRGPIWMYAMLTHELVHVCRAFAVFDPKLGGGVLVSIHTYDLPYNVGDVIEIEESKELVQ